ncbi:MAG: DUF4395 domain-containing protein [Acidimicrobiales bacterium]
MSNPKDLLRFPDPVDEVSARLVAGGVVSLTLVILVARQPWLIVVLAYGFVARVATGPTLSPLGQLVTRVVTPRLSVTPRPVPGPPKRFAQGIGAVLSTSAALAHFGFGATAVASLLVVLILAAASLEAFAGFCLGCRLFGRLMAVGLVPASVCAACADVSRRQGPAHAGSGVAG